MISIQTGRMGERAKLAQYKNVSKLSPNNLQMLSNLLDMPTSIDVRKERGDFRLSYMI